MKHQLKFGFSGLSKLPVNLFGSAMGIAGLALAWKLAASFWNLSNTIFTVIGSIAWLTFILLALGYTFKWICFPSLVKEEFNHPVIGNFFGTIPIGLLLLSSITRSGSPALAEIIWSIASGMMLLLTYTIVYRLLTIKQDHLNATPAWLIPGVGTLDIAVTGREISFGWAKEISLLSFAIGIIMALVFFTMILSRLMHHDKLAKRMEPSLIILIAPFAVGFLGYFSITGQIDFFATILFYFGVFLFTIVFSKVFFQKLPFMHTWWAVGFPIAALSNAALKYAMHKNAFLSNTVAVVLLLIVTLLIAYMFLKSLFLLFNKRLFLS